MGFELRHDHLCVIMVLPLLSIILTGHKKQHHKFVDTSKLIVRWQNCRSDIAMAAIFMSSCTHVKFQYVRYILYSKSRMYH